MKRIPRILFALALSATAGGFLMMRAAGGYGAESGRSTGKATLGTLKTPEAGAPARTERTQAMVATIRPEVVEEPAVVRVSGTLTADEKSDVASNANGIVAKTFIERGSVVKKGDVLVQLDPADTENMLAEGEAGVEELRVRLGLNDPGQRYNAEDQPEVRMARSARDLAERNFKRYSELHQQGATSRVDFDRVQTEYDAATQRYDQALHQIRQVYQSYQTALARLKILKKMVADTTIVAPCDGWVSEKYVSVGERVTTNPMGAGAKVVTLVRTDPLRLVLTVPQQSTGAARPGLMVRFKVDSFPDRTFTGEVKYIAPSLEPNTRSLMVEAVAPNPDGTLRPGLFATAEILLPETARIVLVPTSAVIKEGDVAKVFVVRDGIAREQVVSFGETKEDHIRITTGLTGEETLVAVAQGVHDGDEIS